MSKSKFFLPFVLCFFLANISSSRAEDKFIQLKNINGFIQVQKHGDNAWLKADEKSTLTNGDKIRSFLESSVILIFPDNSEFILGENSFLEIKDISKNPKTNQAKRELKLNVGSLRYKVPPKEEKLTEFKIHSSTSIVGITGTEGIVTTQGEGKETKNFLIQGATYNTDDEGGSGDYQQAGNIYTNDGQGADMYTGDPEGEANDETQLDEQVVSAVNDIVAKIEAKKSQGYDVFNLEPRVDDLFALLESREYEKVRSLISEIESLLEKAVMLSGLYEEYKDKINELTEQIDEKQRTGFDVSSIWALMSRIEQYIREGSSEKIDNLISQVIQMLAALQEDSSDDSGHDFLSEYENIQALVLEKESKGFALDEVKEILRESKIYYENGNMAKAYSLLDEAKVSLDEALKEFPEFLNNKLDELIAQTEEKKQEGFNVEELQLLIEDIKKLVEEESFIKAKESIVQLEDGLANLHKDIPVDWEVKINSLNKKIEHLKALGYDLAGINDFLIALDKYIKKTDLDNLQFTYDQIMSSLKNLGLPKAFEEDLNNFKEKVKEKEDQGFDLKEVKILIEQIESAIEKGDINLARSFLEQAKDKLDKMADTEPPIVEILKFEEKQDQISLEGFASDNIKVKDVFVNNSQVDILEDGKFNYSTSPYPGLEQLIITAEDMSGNISPPVTLTLENKAQASVENGEIEDASLDYGEGHVLVKGRFLPGGKVEVNQEGISCDKDGVFSAEVKVTEDLVSDGIIIIGINPDGSKTDEVKITVEDKWSPVIEVESVEFTENVAPDLNVDPFIYNDDTLSVTGTVSVKIMANIKGKVSDIGGKVALLKAFDRDLEYQDDGSFLASYSITPQDISTNIYAEDEAGNSSEQKVVFDTELKAPILKINGHEALMNNEGGFGDEINLTKELKELLIQLVSIDGGILAEQRLPVADVLPPELEITDVSYTLKDVTISGKSEQQSQIADKGKKLFSNSFEVGTDGFFTFTVPAPAEPIEAVFIATNIEGKVSDEISLMINPLKDDKVPNLFISEPQYNGDTVVIEGFAEDEYGLDSVTIDDEAVELKDGGKFSKEIKMSEDLSFIEIIAKDLSGNVAKEIIALEDKEPPKIIIDIWEIQDGKLIIKGKAFDNIGVMEVRLDDMPLIQGDSKELAFEYEGVINEESKDAVIHAKDLFNNESSEGPREITIPEDTVPPTGASIKMEYGSPVVYVSGKVADPAGIKAVYVNGNEIEVYDDGSFNVKLDINVSTLEFVTEAPVYDNGKVKLAGKVKQVKFDPAQVIVEAEDLLGNKGQIYSEKVGPYKMNEVKVFIDGDPVDVTESGNFNVEKGLILGKRSYDVEAEDPFENSTKTTIELEKNPPLLELNSLEYKTDEKAVLLTGKAADSESGLFSIAVNGVNIEFNDDGTFSYKASINESSLGIEASDHVGNISSITKDVRPPDIWPPVFSLKIRPKPAIVGNPLYVEITSLDSKTGMPEILNAFPKVTAKIEGKEFQLPVEGEGSSFMATLDTKGLTPAIGKVSIEGTDKAGNTSSEIKGSNTFTLVEQDQIDPSFTINTMPDPIALGNEAKIQIFSSEELKTPPILEATLPFKQTVPLNLTKVSGQEYSSVLKISLEESLGQVTLSLTGGEDLSGNTHGKTEKQINIIVPAQQQEIPLNVGQIEFNIDRIRLSGSTASEAVVHIDIGQYSQDIVSSLEGKFKFEKIFTKEQLDDLYKTSEFITAKLKAHNYSGFESQLKVFDIKLPVRAEEAAQNFKIALQPIPVEQGGILNINIEAVISLPELPKGIIYLPDGKRVAVTLEVNGNILKGQFSVAKDAPLGRARFEVVSGAVRQSVPFEIVLSSAWMQRINKDQFYSIRSIPDPLIIGKEAEFVVDTQGELDNAPVMTLNLPNNKKVIIALSGGSRNFRGRYLVPEDTTPGRAEIVLNSGTVDEVRRPCAVEEEFIAAEKMDVFLFSNPNPLMAGEAFDVKVNFPRMISFKPKVILKTSGGRLFEIPLNGNPPINSFGGRFTVPSDVVTGLATFIVKDDIGKTIKSFPTNIIPSLTTKKGIDIYIFPDVLKPLEKATIQVNSITTITEKLSAQVSFSNGSKVMVPLSGTGNQAKGILAVPEQASFGMATVSIFDSKNQNLGTSRIEVVEQKGMGGPVNAFLSNPNFMPSEKVQLIIEAGWPLPFRPKAALVHDGGTVNINILGNVPGNRFNGEFTAPTTEIKGGRIEIKDDKGFVIADIPIMQQDAFGKGQLILNPMPPIIGQPLNITVVAPMIVDRAPSLRLISEEGTKQLKLIGALPGDRFNATLPVLDVPITAIEIIDPEGRVVERMPLSMKSMQSQMDFNLEFTSPVVPGQMASVILRSINPVSFIPKFQLDFAGKIIDVPLTGVPYGRDFVGKFTLSSIAIIGNINAQVFDPQGRMIWQKMIAQQGATPTGNIFLNVMPVGSDGFDLSWDMLNGASYYVIKYGPKGNMQTKVEVRGQTWTTIKGLFSGTTYDLELIAFDANNREITRSAIVTSTCGQTMRQLFVQDMVTGSDVNLLWDNYSGADMYKVAYGLTPGNFTNNFDVKGTQYVIKDLTMGMEYFIKVFALYQGKVIGESREIVADLMYSMPTGVDIMVNPDPPQINNTLNIDLHFYNDIYFIPRVLVRLQNGTTEFPAVTGSTKRDFKAVLSSDRLVANVMSVEVEDDKGMHIGDRPFDTGRNMMDDLNIMVNPDPPQIGNDLNVVARFENPIGFVPRIIFSFFDGRREFPSVSGYGQEFRTKLTADKFLSSLMVIDVEDDKGAHLGDRFFGEEASDSIGTPVFMVQPMPPVIGSAVDISVEIPNIMPLAPKFRLNYADGSNKVFDLQGTLPGNKFYLHINALEKSLLSIDLLDPLGNQRDTFYISGGGQAEVNIFTNPDVPIIGQSLYVNAEFSNNVPYIPRLFVEFVDGIRKNYTFPQGPNNKSYNFTIPAADIINNVSRIGIEDDRGEFLDDRIFDNSNVQQVYANIIINPDPPQVGNYLYLKAEFSTAVTYTPKAVIEFQDGTRKYQDLAKTSSLIYQVNVPPDIMSKAVECVVIEDDRGALLSDRCFGATETSPLNITVNPDPPTPNQSLYVVATFDYAVPFVPRLFIELDGGIRKNYQFPQNANLTQYSFTVPAADITSNVMRVGVEDNMGTFLDDRIFNDEGPLNVNIMTNPDQPQIAQSFIVTAQFDGPVYFIPKMQLELEGGIVRTYTFPQAAGSTQYSFTVPAADVTNSLIRIEIQDDMGQFIDDHIFDTGDCGVTNIMINPEPAQINQQLIVTAQFDCPVGFVPKLQLELEGGIIKNYTFPQASGLSYYSFTVPATAMTNYLRRVEIQDDKGAFLNDRFFGEEGETAIDIYVNPMPPVPYSNLTVNANFNQAVPYIPKLKLFYNDGTQKPYNFQGAVLQTSYSMTIPGNDVSKPLDRIEIYDDNGIFLQDFFFEGNGENIPIININPDPPIPNQSIYVTLTFPENAYYIPKIEMELSSGTRQEFNFSQTAGQKVYSMTIPSTNVYQPVNKIEAFDNEGQYLTDISFVDEGSDFFIYLDCEGATSINVSWDYVSWIQNFKIYYGDEQGNYNGQGSPIMIGNNTSQLLSDLVAGDTYYVKVEGYDATGNLALTSYEEFVQCVEENLPAITNLWKDQTNNPGEIIVRWDPVSGVDGYRVFYGLSSNAYTDFIEVYGQNTTQAFLSSLNSGQVYYINVKTFTNDGRESPWYPNELVATPGSVISGSGLFTINPINIDFDNAQTGTNTTTQNVILSNQSSTNVNVKWKIQQDLTNSSMNSTIAQSNVHIDQTSYSIGPNGTATSNIYISVPSTSVYPGSYITTIEYYIDADGDNIRDTDESFAELFVDLFFGAEGLNISEFGVDFGNIMPDSTTSWANFTINNTSGNTLSHITVIKPTLQNFDDGSSTIPAANVECEVPASIGYESSTTGKVRVIVPSGTQEGEYGGMVMIYSDLNNDGSADSDDPLDTFGIRVMVNSTSQPKPITDIRAVDRGTGGTVDLYWTDPNTDISKYNIYYSTSEDFVFNNTPNLTTSNKTMQVTGLTNNTEYFFAVLPVIDDVEVDYSVYSVRATPTTNETEDTVPPTFAGLTNAYATGEDKKVHLDWSQAQDESTPIRYYVYRKHDNNDFTEIYNNTNITSYLDIVPQSGVTYDYMVRAEDSLGNMELNNKVESATPYGPIDHIHLSAQATESTMGSPVLVKVEALDGSGNVITSFNDDVNISVSESSTRMLNSWLLSVQDRVTGDQAEVSMYQGVGYFTVDALEPETITISTVGINNDGPLEIAFAPSSSASSPVSLAVQGPSKAVLGNNGGALIWISVIDSYGRVYKDYVGRVKITLTGSVSGTSKVSWSLEQGSGEAQLSHSKYVFSADDNGVACILVKDIYTSDETVTITVSYVDGDVPVASDSHSVNFVSNVDRYIAKSSAFVGLSHEALGSRIKFTLYAADANDNVISGYNGVAEVIDKQETIDNNSSYVINGDSIQFNDGVAEFYLDDSEYETVTFNVADKLDSTIKIKPSDLSVVFRSADQNPPEITNVVAETPYLVHLYFSEEIDSTNALIKANYTGVGVIRTVCWYNDNVTLHLDSALPAGGASIDVNGDSPNGIKDKDGNFMGDKTESFTVPNVDYQGGAMPSGDWFELQVSDTSPHPGDTVTVKIFHKNACGYLTGSNRVNKTQDVDTATVTYGGTADVSGDTSVDVSSGEATFTFTVDSGATTGQTITIGAVSGDVSGSFAPSITVQ